MSSILDPGKKDRKKAGRAADDAVIGDFSGGGAFGGGSFTEDGQFTQDLGQFGGIFSQIMGQLGQAGQPGGAGGNLGALSQVGGQSMGALGGGGQFGQANPAMLAQLQQTAMNQFGVLGQDPSQIGADRTNILNQLAAPGEQQARAGLAENLFATGRSGTTGGQLDNRALLEAQGTAALQRQLAGQDFGRQIQQDALGRLSSSLGLGESLVQGQFGRDMGRNQLAGQRALDRFSIAGNIFDAQRQSALDPFSQFSAGLGSLGQIQNFGMQNFNAALGANQARSSSLLGGANVHQANAQAANAASIGNFATGALGALSGGGMFDGIFSGLMGGGKEGG